MGEIWSLFNKNILLNHYIAFSYIFPVDSNYYKYAFIKHTEAL